jgi:diguanylate cyclase (GGDEF)-like protein
MNDVSARLLAGAAGERDTVAAGRRPVVLLIEDSAPLRALMGHQLAADGYELRETGAGEEGLRMAVEDPPDVVLLDLTLPGELQGLEVLDAFARDPSLADVPVIVVTGTADPETLANTLAKGAHDFLGKPYDGIELRARVAVALRTKQLHDGLRLANERLAHDALTDALTGLANRRHGLTELERMTAFAMRHDEPFGIIELDVDGFKAINDRHGHAIGDAVLRSISESLVAGLRREDLLVRWGGDEFVALLPQANPASVLAVAERLRRCVRANPLQIGSLKLETTVSVGWACGMTESPDQLMGRADAAVYAAKRAGRDTVSPRAVAEDD